jgi:hypothetical protein
LANHIAAKNVKSQDKEKQHACVVMRNATEELEIGFAGFLLRYLDFTIGTAIPH